VALYPEVAVMVQSERIMYEFYNTSCARNDLKLFLTPVSGFLRGSGEDDAGSN
jgi:hypothetical protein